MAKRGPKKKAAPAGLGVEPLRSQNIIIGGHRTSMRLEPSMWDALDDIVRRENMTVNDLCSRIKERVDEQNSRRGTDVTLSSAVRVFIAAYYRRAATDEGHTRARHGEGDPFAGTPFDLSADSLGEPPNDRPSGPGPGYSGSGPSYSSRAASDRAWSDV